MEVQLRSKCQKMRVYQQLSGAHFIFPQQSSLAVRAYSLDDVNRIKNQKRLTNSSESSINNQDIDGLTTFVSNFRWSIIFFILSSEDMVAMMDDENSFLHQVQNMIDRTIIFPKRNDTEAVGDAKRNATSQMFQPPRIMCVSSPDQAIECLTTFADSINGKRVIKRREFFERQQISAYCYPLETLRQNSDDSGALIELKNDISAAAASHVAGAIRDWAQRFDLPPGEADVLLRLLDNLNSVARASSNDLAKVPIDSHTKVLLQLFFDQETKGPTLQQQMHNIDTFHPVQDQRSQYELNEAAMNHQLQENQGFEHQLIGENPIQDQCSQYVLNEAAMNQHLQENQGFQHQLTGQNPIQDQRSQYLPNEAAANQHRQENQVFQHQLIGQNTYNNDDHQLSHQQYIDIRNPSFQPYVANGTLSSNLDQRSPYLVNHDRAGNLSHAPERLLSRSTPQPPSNYQRVSNIKPELLIQYQTPSDFAPQMQFPVTPGWRQMQCPPSHLDCERSMHELSLRQNAAPLLLHQKPVSRSEAFVRQHENHGSYNGNVADSKYLTTHGQIANLPSADSNYYCIFILLQFLNRSATANELCSFKLESESTSTQPKRIL